MDRLVAVFAIAAGFLATALVLFAASSHHRGVFAILLVLFAVTFVAGLGDLFLSKPRLVLGEPYTEMRPLGEPRLSTSNPPAYTGSTISVSATSSHALAAVYDEASFAYVPVSNQPRLGSKEALHVSAQFSFWDSTGERLYKMDGRWIGTDQYTQSERTLGTPEINIPKRPKPDPLDVAMKYLDEDEAYAFNDENRFAGPDLRHKPLGQPPTRVEVVVTSPGAYKAKGVFKLTADSNGRIVIQRTG